jgi:hypothetical protein
MISLSALVPIGAVRNAGSSILKKNGVNHRRSVHPISTFEVYKSSTLPLSYVGVFN